MRPPIEIEEDLRFGKHRGKSVSQIWKGYDDDFEIHIEKYLQLVFDIIGKQKPEVDQKIKIPRLSEKFIKSNLNLFFNSNEIKFKIIVKDSYLYIIDSNDNESIIELIKNILNCDFENIKWDYFEIGKESEYLKITNEDIEDLQSLKSFRKNPDNYELYLIFKNKNPKYVKKLKYNFELKHKRILDIEEINGDPQYILWCIKYFKNKFYIHTSDMDVLENTPYKILKSFEFKYINDNCVNFTPIFKFKKIQLPTDIKNMNKNISDKFDSWEDSNQPYNNDHEDQKYYWSDYDSPDDFYIDNVWGRG